jgi:hypothetical protein
MASDRQAMTAHNRDGQLIVDLIREVLANDWDPIRVMSDPDWARDEYDDYIGTLQRLLAVGADADFIAKYLCFVEEQLIGLEGRPAPTRMLVAAKLIALTSGSAESRD